jgi:hypothetical protein
MNRMLGRQRASCQGAVMKLQHGLVATVGDTRALQRRVASLCSERKNLLLNRQVSPVTTLLQELNRAAQAPRRTAPDRCPFMQQNPLPEAGRVPPSTPSPAHLFLASWLARPCLARLRLSQSPCLAKHVSSPCQKLLTRETNKHNKEEASQSLTRQHPGASLPR